MPDVIEYIHGSKVQHGFLNRRIYIMHLDPRRGTGCGRGKASDRDGLRRTRGLRDAVAFAISSIPRMTTEFPVRAGWRGSGDLLVGMAFSAADHPGTAAAGTGAPSGMGGFGRRALFPAQLALQKVLQHFIQLFLFGFVHGEYSKYRRTAGCGAVNARLLHSSGWFETGVRYSFRSFGGNL